MKLGSTIFILGSGGFARELKTYIQIHTQEPHLRRSGTFDKILYDEGYNIFLVSDDGDLTVKEYHNKLSGLSGNYYSIMGSGQCHIKAKMQKEIMEPLMSFIHPMSRVISEAKIGKGSVIAPSAVVAPRANIGQHVLINYGCMLGHDAIVGDLSTISPGAFIGGFCKIGDAVYIGANSSVKEGINIGKNSVIAMGSVITKNVPANSIAIGVPAMIFPLSEWNTIKVQMSSNMKYEQDRLRKNSGVI